MHLYLIFSQRESIITLIYSQFSFSYAADFLVSQVFLVALEGKTKSPSDE